MRGAGVLALVAISSAALSLPAKASFIVCNKTSYVLYAAVGAKDRETSPRTAGRE